MAGVILFLLEDWKASLLFSWVFSLFQFPVRFHVSHKNFSYSTWVSNSWKKASQCGTPHSFWCWVWCKFFEVGFGMELSHSRCTHPIPELRFYFFATMCFINRWCLDKKNMKEPYQYKCDNRSTGSTLFPGNSNSQRVHFCSELKEATRASLSPPRRANGANCHVNFFMCVW